MVTLKRQKNGTVEQFDIPDSPYKEAVEIYKMEYEKAAQRYNDLYNAAWTNFSYTALVSGGLLTFAGARFVTPLTVLLACLPLVFWWMTSFEPLNRYGDKVQSELGEIEKALTALCISKEFPVEAQKGLTHFSNFAKRGKDHSSSVESIWRVRHVVRVTAILLSLTALAFGVKVACLVIQGEPLTVRTEPLNVIVTSPTPTVTPPASARPEGYPPPTASPSPK